MKLKRTTIVALLLVFSVIIFSTNSFAVQLLTKEKALQEMFPDVDKVTTEEIKLTAAQITKVKERLGGKLVHYQKGSKSEGVEEKTTYTFYYGMKNDKIIRIAIIDVQPGKWGPVEYIVAINLNPGTVQNLAVMAYMEKRGRPIARRNFLKQFVGKTKNDPISVKSSKGIRRDIRSISGATISSDATCFTVRKVLALYEEVFLKKSVQVSQKN